MSDVESWCYSLLAQAGHENLRCHWGIFQFFPPFPLLIFPGADVFWAVESTEITTALLLPCNNPAHILRAVKDKVTSDTHKAN